MILSLVTNGRAAGAAVLFVLLFVSIGIAAGRATPGSDWQPTCPHCGQPNARWQGISR